MRAFVIAATALTCLSACPGNPTEALSGTGLDGGESTTEDSLTDSPIPETSRGPVEDSDDGASSATTTSTDPTVAPLDDGASETSDASASETLDPTTTDSDGDGPPGTEGTSTSATGSGVCEEADELNDDEASAIDMGSLGCAGETLQSGSIADGATSPDWFSYYGVHDEASCGTNGLPVVTVTSGGPLEICAFASCPGGAALVDVCYMGLPANSPSGFPGCCGTDVVALDVNCPPTDESATVMVEVVTADAACVSYTLSVEY